MKTRKVATPEQKAARAAKIQKMRQLAKIIGSMSDAQRQQIIDTHPIATIEGRILSPKNQCMIAMQCPHATVTGGFNQWITAGRAVKKGEHGLCIWGPARGKKGDESNAEPDATQAEAPDRCGFILLTVFDISQTQEKGAEEQQPAEIAANIVAANPVMLADALQNTLALEMEVA